MNPKSCASASSATVAKANGVQETRQENTSRRCVEGSRHAGGVLAADPAAVEIDVPDTTVAVVDRQALDRIVTNLVTNAFRYGTPPVKVRAEQTDRHFRLTVEDRGVGVGPEFVPDLFERFTRSEGSRATAAGTGLGLAIARSYARAHGGDLVYEDAMPHGACFRLVLPMRVGPT